MQPTIPVNWRSEEALQWTRAEFNAKPQRRKGRKGLGNGAVIAEGIGYVFLLIPNRIKELKDAGRAEGLAEAREEAREARREAMRQALTEAWEEGRAEGIQEVRERRNRERYAEERKVVRTLLACQGRGEITLEQLRAVLAEYCNYNGNGKND